ncbi:conserved hypothetical protein [Tenacibaculum litopenaei]|uniref:hypothetical protein n=1 Tax=Tenacibaculum litopenaei TaxID=396016 RepID=UPI0038964A5C
MHKTSSNIRCSDCGVFTENSDYCKQCGAVISFRKKRELKIAQVQQEEVHAYEDALANPNLPKRLMRHKNALMRMFGYLLQSVYFVGSLIGALLAWFVAMVAAG